MLVLLCVMGPAPMDLQFWPGAVVMMLISTLTASLVTGGDRRGSWSAGADGVRDLRHDALPAASRRPMTRPLDPIDRVSEVLFGLIMVLSFTGSLSVAEAGREDVRTMLVGALGCNLAWGVIDAVFYLMGSLAEKSRGLLIYRAVREAADPERARRLIADALPPVVASVLEPAELEAMHARLKQLPSHPCGAADGTTGGARWGCSCSCSCPRSRW